MTLEKTELTVRGPILLGTLAILLLIVGVLGWAAIARISGAIVAEGIVEPGAAQQTVSHETGGPVERLFVSEGDYVKKGDPLLLLETSETSGRLSLLENRIILLMAERDRHRADEERLADLSFDVGTLTFAALKGGAETRSALADQRRLFQSARQARAMAARELTTQGDRIAAQVSGLAARESALKQQLTFAREELADQESLLERGLASRRPLNSLRREVARLEGALAELAAARKTARIELEAIATRERQLDAQARVQGAEGIAATSEELRRLKGEAMLLRHRLSGATLRAPLAGLVHDLKIAGDGVLLQPHQPILQIVPRTTRKRILASMPPSQIAGISVGQIVEVRHQGAAPQEPQQWEGRVTHISAHALPDREGEAADFRVTVLLPGLDPQAAALLPGMRTQLFFRTSPRTPLSFFVQPLRDYFTQAFREG